jgi:hypothetical protein
MILIINIIKKSIIFHYKFIRLLFIFLNSTIVPYINRFMLLNFIIGNKIFIIIKKCVLFTNS